MKTVLIYGKFTLNLCAQALHTRVKLYNIDPHVHIWLLADFKPYAKHNVNFASCYLHSVHFNPISVDETIIINLKPFLIYLQTWNRATYEKNGREFFEWLLLSPKMYLYEPVDNVNFK